MLFCKILSLEKLKKKLSSISCLTNIPKSSTPQLIPEPSYPWFRTLDIVGNTHSCIFDSEFTNSQDNLVKVMGWYDNEMGYAARIGDLVAHLSN